MTPFLHGTLAFEVHSLCMLQYLAVPALAVLNHQFLCTILDSILSRVLQLLHSMYRIMGKVLHGV